MLYTWSLCTIVSPLSIFFSFLKCFFPKVWRKTQQLHLWPGPSLLVARQLQAITLPRKLSSWSPPLLRVSMRQFKRIHCLIIHCYSCTVWMCSCQQWRWDRRSTQDRVLGELSCISCWERSVSYLQMFDLFITSLSLQSSQLLIFLSRSPLLAQKHLELGTWNLW